MPDSHVPAYVVDAPYLYRRGGSPYQDSDGGEWPDNLQRFALLGWVAAHLAAGELDPSWTPEVVHAHDWHAALACAYMAAHPATARGLGLHDPQPGLPGPVPARRLRAARPAVALHGARTGSSSTASSSFMKAGLKFADRITTVSPTYAREIATHEFGFGLDGVLRGRGARRLRASSTASTATVWNPATDAALAARYAPREPAGQGALQARAAGRAGPGARRRCAAVRRGQPPDVAKGPRPGAGGAAGAAAARRAAARCWAPASRRSKRPSAAAAGAPGQVRGAHRLRRGAGAPPDRRRRRDPRALALRALRPDADVRPALRHAAAGAARRRPGRHRGRRQRRRGARRPRHRLRLRRRHAVRARAARCSARCSAYAPARAVAQPDAARDGPGLFVVGRGQRYVALYEAIAR